jgi:hypothetical protein
MALARPPRNHENGDAAKAIFILVPRREILRSPHVLMPHLSKDEQRRRVAELVAQEKGEECPELVVEYTTAQLGGGQVEYRCRKDTPVEYLDLSPEQARYVGIDIEPRELDETGGHPRL